MEATTYQSFMEQRISQITEACSHCGKCYEVCPMVSYSEAKGADPEQVTKSVIDIINDRPHEPEGAIWAKIARKAEFASRPVRKTSIRAKCSPTPS